VVLDSSLRSEWQLKGIMKKYFDILLDDLKGCSLKEGCVPIAALLVFKNQIISKHINGMNALDHAEILVLKEASEKLGPKIKEAILYITLEPCAMCKAAISLSGIKKVYFGAYSNKSVEDGNVEYYGGFQEKVFADVLRFFFQSKRDALDLKVKKTLI